MFTTITITGGPFLRPDGQPATGRFLATLSVRMTNGIEQIDPTPIYGVLNAAGMLQNYTGQQPFTLEANDDPGTTPTAPTASYELVLELDNDQPEPHYVVISHTAPSATVDLSTLLV